MHANQMQKTPAQMTQRTRGRQSRKRFPPRPPSTCLSRKPNAERYDLSINRQGANSSKGKQLFKIKDKAGYCTNSMS